jgi:predicted small metal-binding protein
LHPQGSATILRARSHQTDKEYDMAKSITCSDTGADCPFSVRTAEESELMQHLQMHASTAHPDMEMNAETMAKVQSIIKTV